MSKIPVAIVDWWTESRVDGDRIKFKVRWDDGSETVTLKRVDLELPGDAIKDCDYLYPAIKAMGA